MRICITVNSQYNSSKTDNLNTSNSDDVIGNPNISRINVHTKISLNKLITLQRETDTQSSIIINNNITDEKNTSEEISCHQNLAEVIDHTCDENGNNVLNIEEVADVTSIYSVNAIITYLRTMMIILSINITNHSYHLIITKMYLIKHNMIQRNEDFVIIETLFCIYY